jgi:C4-type Zn-finger protein
MPSFGDSVRGDSDPVVFTANLDCPKCEATFEGVWHDDSMDMEQVVDIAPIQAVCPKCGHTWEAEYPGWTAFTEA